jgi:tetratricopeptide (TPR) repeat protein
VIRLQPDNSDAYFNRGLAYKKKGEFDAALKDYDAAIRLEPSHAKAIYDRGNVYMQKGLYGQAIDDYMNAFESWFE